MFNLFSINYIFIYVIYLIYLFILYFYLFCFNKNTLKIYNIMLVNKMFGEDYFVMISGDKELMNAF